MKNYFLFALICIAAASCNNSKVDKVERDGESTIYNVETDDPEMNVAIKKANQSLGIFQKAFESHNPDYNYLSLKQRFNTSNGGGEHIWISILDYENGKYTGVVNDKPEMTTEIKLGDTIVVNNNNISDWMYVDHGKLQGGYTLRVLRNRMTAEEKKQFDTECGFTIDDAK